MPRICPRIRIRRSRRARCLAPRRCCRISSGPYRGYGSIFAFMPIFHSTYPLDSNVVESPDAQRPAVWRELHLQHQLHRQRRCDRRRPRPRAAAGPRRRRQLLRCAPIRPSTKNSTRTWAARRTCSRANAVWELPRLSSEASAMKASGIRREQLAVVWRADGRFGRSL